MRPKRYSRNARSPFKGIDRKPTGERFPYRLLMGGRGAERTTKGELLPVAPLRVVCRVASLRIASAVVTRVTEGRIRRLRARRLEWDKESRTWFLVLDF
jgi:hypothetical protein